ncbi:MAG: benzylsuccinate CoA-transferase BbsE subunit [Acidimicrobiales bacterium]|jgi:benzylsuccinate CoA-transferase BbsE subunit
MSGPLEGLKVIDLSALAGSYGTRMMAAMGADVVKVEPPEGNPMRRLAPFADGAPDNEASLWWAYLAMGTKSVVVDPRTTEGADQLRSLLREADVVVDDNGPDELDQQGLGYDSIAADNPGVIWISITPFGRNGPKRDWKLTNLGAWAASGVLYTVGFEDQPPVAPGGPAQLALHATALNGAISTMLALRARRQTGRGQLVDLAISEAALMVSPETGVTVFLDDRVHRVRSGNRRTLTRPFGLYPCSDGYISILILMPRHWEALANWMQEAMGNEAATDPVFNDMTVRGETMELIDGWTEELCASMTRLEFFQESQRRGIPVTPVNTIEALLTDPHLEAVAFWKQTELPMGGDVTIPGAPFRANLDWWATARAPRLGEHSA